MALRKQAGDETLGESLSYLESIIERDLSEGRAAAHEAHPPPDRAAAAPLSARKLIASLVTMFGDEAAAKSIELKGAPTSLQVDCDPVILMRLLTNLVANAVKHTQAGTILIGARRRRGAVTFEVHDTGPGIEGKRLETLFAPYVKSDTSQGEGLGLSVVRSLAAEHGLSISVRSVPGRGSVFSIDGVPRAQEIPAGP